MFGTFFSLDLDRFYLAVPERGGSSSELRVYFLQRWYGLADGVLEDTIYDSQGMQGFTRIDLGPDAPTLLKFRRLLETNDLCKSLFTAIGFTAANVSDIAKLANSSTGKKPRSTPARATPRTVI